MWAPDVDTTQRVPGVLFGICFRHWALHFLQAYLAAWVWCHEYSFDRQLKFYYA
ncbi:hypothetical protein M413DRAFT_440108 [Hebeloma cylindrosporum]|uniref:Uncharacterized protein n=1 Tax=Hebeloma cylindrosporum TaxID=76867 RepID=A0A0C3CI09_HEBCY|nr:hypothetical protein M413DRAFT_440108 [Hebeloma cylindrosporum h7]